MIREGINIHNGFAIVDAANGQVVQLANNLLEARALVKSLCGQYMSTMYIHMLVPNAIAKVEYHEPEIIGLGEYL